MIMRLYHGPVTTAMLLETHNTAIPLALDLGYNDILLSHQDSLSLACHLGLWFSSGSVRFSYYTPLGVVNSAHFPTCWYAGYNLYKAQMIVF